MQKVSLWNEHTKILFVIALVLNLIFLYFNYGSTYYDGYRLLHGEIAYNIIHHGKAQSSPDHRGYLGSLWLKNGRVPEIYEAHDIKFGSPSKHPTTDIHVGYSLIMSLVWFFTGTYRYLDIGLLQVLIFSFLILFFYQIAFILFKQKIIALFSTSALLFFFPIVFLNVNILRDIWPFYGIIMILYGVLAYLIANKHWLNVVVGGGVFALCQFIRPPTFITLVTLSCILIGYSLVDRGKIKKIILVLCSLWITNGLFFWAPFIAYNNYAYGRNFVGPVGQNLLEGLGEFSNKWGYRLEDYWFAVFIKENYNLIKGTQEADDKAKELFLEAVKEEPLFYIKSVLRRIHRILLPALSWFPWLYNDAYYDQIEGFKDRIVYLLNHITDWRVLVDIIVRHIYVRLYLLIGYIGMIFLIMRKKYFPFFLLYGGIIVSSYSVIFSHVEHRYLIPAFGVFPFFVGYALFEFFSKRSIE